MIIIIIDFVTFFVSRYNSIFIPVLKQLSHIPNRINVFMDEEGIILLSDWHNSAEFDEYPVI